MTTSSDGPEERAIKYLCEDGRGPYGRWHVPDLLADDGSVELLFVFESPHVDELAAGLPVVGGAGKSALRYLLPSGPGTLGLGAFVQERHAAGDGRIAILNVSNVPMQVAAFGEGDAPDLIDREWTQIERARRSGARSVSSMRGVAAREMSTALAEGLRRKISEVDTDPEVRIVAAGAFARRMVAAAVPDLTPAPLRVPHPSYNQWHRTGNQDLPDLVATRERFVRATGTS